MHDEISLLDATAQALLVRRGEVKPQELVEAAIARAERLEPRLHAIVTRQFERARDEAASVSLPRGPFRGVPYLLKDLGAYLDGDPLYAGMGALARAGWRERRGAPARRGAGLARAHRVAGARHRADDRARGLRRDAQPMEGDALAGRIERR